MSATIIDPTSTRAPKYINLSLCLHFGESSDKIDKVKPKPAKIRDRIIKISKILCNISLLFFIKRDSYSREILQALAKALKSKLF